MTGIVAELHPYGLTNVTAACVALDVAPFSATNPDEFLFWDGIHPTKDGHAILAQKAAEIIR